MNPNFPNSEQSRSDDSITEVTQPNAASSGAEALKRDRFELISAYLDGEVTADERRQVELWLQTDDKAKQLHARMMMLRRGFQNLPTPVAQPVERTVQQVVTKIERKSRRKVFTWSGMAIAAMFVSAMVGGLPSPEYAANNLLTGTTAQAPQPALGVPEDALMIALDRPLIPIPRAASSQTVDPSPSRELN